MEPGTNRIIERHWQRGRGYLRTRQLPAAQVQLDSLRRLAPEDVRTLLLAAQMAWRRDAVRESAALALAAAKIVPDDPGLLRAAIEALLQAGESAAAHALLDRSIWQHSDDIEALTASAGFLQDFNEPARALAALDRIAAQHVDKAALHLFRGQQLEYLGKLDAAVACYRQALQRDPACGRAAYWLARMPRHASSLELHGLIDTGLQHARHATEMHAAFEFALYHVLEGQGRYDGAWDALVRGNAEMRAISRPEASTQGMPMRRFMDGLAAHPIDCASGASEGPHPIFIVGLPRSGTTLLERMLSNHAQVATAGELVDFGHALLWAAHTRQLFSETFLARVPQMDWAEVGRRYLAQTTWRAQRKPYFIDKAPTNWTVAGLAHAALPGARILNVVRDPLDVCFGNWRVMFGNAYPWTYDFADLAGQYHDYRETMRRWHAMLPGAVLDVAYAELVHDPARVLRRVFEFCGLPWQAGCEDPRRNDAPVTTLSSAQVRGPLHAQGLERWRPYAAQLEPLRQRLQVAAPGTARE